MASTLAVSRRAGELRLEGRLRQLERESRVLQRAVLERRPGLRGRSTSEQVKLPRLRGDRVMEVANDQRAYAEQYFREVDKALAFLRRNRRNKVVLKQGDRTIVKYEGRNHVLLEELGADGSRTVRKFRK
jgi:hypothetical protein